MQYVDKNDGRQGNEDEPLAHNVSEVSEAGRLFLIEHVSSTTSLIYICLKLNV